MHVVRPEELRGILLIFLFSEVGSESEMHSLLGINYKVSDLLCIKSTPLGIWPEGTLLNYSGLISMLLTLGLS